MDLKEKVIFFKDESSDCSESSGEIELNTLNDQDPLLLPVHAVPVERKVKSKLVKFTNQRNLEDFGVTNHLESNNSLQRTKNKTLQCNVCEKVFKSNKNVIGNDPPRCEECMKTFGHMSNELRIKKIQDVNEKLNVILKKLNKDINKTTKMSRSAEENTFECPACYKVLSSSASLRMHERTHTGERPYECDICSKKFSQSSSLRTHRMIHTGERPFPCDLCDKRFINKAFLNIHYRSHTGEKPHECTICNKHFSQKSSLNTHRKIHLNDKPFECEFCNKKFINLTFLKVHIRKHTGEKPFVCELCMKTYSQQSSLNTHKRVVHGFINVD